SRRRKGTEHVVAACAALDCDLEIVEGLDHRRAFERYRRADVIVDQLNAGWYGVFAIEAMALGKPVVTFLHDEAVRRTSEAFGIDVPIANATKETLGDVLRPLVDSPDERRRVGAASRAYVEEVHDLERMTDRLLDLYSSLYAARRPAEAARTAQCDLRARRSRVAHPRDAPAAALHALPAAGLVRASRDRDGRDGSPRDRPPDGDLQRFLPLLLRREGGRGAADGDPHLLLVHDAHVDDR